MQPTNDDGFQQLQPTDVSQEGLVRQTTDAQQSIMRIKPHPEMSLATTTIAEWVGELVKEDLFNEEGKGVYWVTKPVGGGKDASLLGIRAAELILTIYGGLSVQCRVISKTGSEAISEITVTDNFAGNSTSEQVITSARYKAADKSVKLKSPEMFIQSIKADQSKAKRNCIFFLIPPPLKSRLEKILRARMAEVTKAQTKKEPIKTTVKKMVKAFGKYGIETGVLEAYIGKPLAGIDADDIVTLRGLYNALETDETTARDIIESMKMKEDESKETAEAAKAEAAADLLNEKKAEPAKAEAKEKKAPAKKEGDSANSQVQALRAELNEHFGADKVDAAIKEKYPKWNMMAPSLKLNALRTIKNTDL